MPAVHICNVMGSLRRFQDTLGLLSQSRTGQCIDLAVEVMISGGNFAAAGMIQTAQCNKKYYVPKVPKVPIVRRDAALNTKKNQPFAE